MFMQRTFSISRSMGFPEVCISIFQEKKKSIAAATRQKVLSSYLTLNLHMEKLEDNKNKREIMGIRITSS
jgi:hypothetical protein